MRGVGSLALCLAVCAGACSKKEEVVVEASDRVHITAADVDRDPEALLPGGAVGLAHVRARDVLTSAFGQRLLGLANSRMPLPPSAGFDPSRDLSDLYAGLYSMQGADVVIVATGTFNREAIERAADGTTMTPLGAPLVKTTYAKQTLYVSRNVGFAVLTEHTAFLGDETGMRRALDRLTEGRLAHDVPQWIDSVLSTPNASMAGALDFTGQAPVAALVGNLPFLQGVRTARVLGNFQAPGINFAGSLTYPDPQTASSASQTIQQMYQRLGTYSFFLQFAGIKNPIQKLETVPQGNDTQFVVALEGGAVEWLLAQAATQLGGTPGSAVPIQIAPGAR